ncbi:hypothetical protein I7I53_08761 [Histoplasma capsulatum var. duboisii H88]|uniref:Uncharacterized protein n=1 Tax=Ajellomyces capsulatus (strain H88) TaxID=544711 RepID=A0A8A1L436_AJEC8|nr:hypothetical protein I7I53_08761 [Histoplasma capsulatum var. duboisii H88]
MGKMVGPYATTLDVLSEGNEQIVAILDQPQCMYCTIYST